MANGYNLIDCKNFQSTLQAPEPIQLYIGKTIKITSQDSCFTIDPNPFEIIEPLEPVVVTETFDNCLECLNIVIENIPRVLPEYFENFTQTIEDQCEIDTNVKFANAYWELFKSLKHGIESGCDNIDLNKITIKKREIDLAKLYDASACIIPDPAPEPEVCIEPTGTPLPTPAPSGT
jgi:hypothetical protein